MRATIEYSYGPLGAKVGETSVTGEFVQAREEGSYTIIEAGEDADGIIGEVEESRQVLTKNVVLVSLGEAAEVAEEIGLLKGQNEAEA